MKRRIRGKGEKKWKYRNKGATLEYCAQNKSPKKVHDVPNRGLFEDRTIYFEFVFAATQIDFHKYRPKKSQAEKTLPRLFTPTATLVKDCEYGACMECVIWWQEEKCDEQQGEGTTRIARSRRRKEEEWIRDGRSSRDWWRKRSKRRTTSWY